MVFFVTIISKISFLKPVSYLDLNFPYEFALSFIDLSNLRIPRILTCFFDARIDYIEIIRHKCRKAEHKPWRKIDNLVDIESHLRLHEWSFPVNPCADLQPRDISFSTLMMFRLKFRFKNHSRFAIFINMNKIYLLYRDE